MSDRSQGSTQSVRRSAARHEAVCIQVAVAVVLLLSICALLYVLSLDAAKAAVG